MISTTPPILNRAIRKPRAKTVRQSSLATVGAVVFATATLLLELGVCQVENTTLFSLLFVKPAPIVGIAILRSKHRCCAVEHDGVGAALSTTIISSSIPIVAFLALSVTPHGAFLRLSVFTDDVFELHTYLFLVINFVPPILLDIPDQIPTDFARVLRDRFRSLSFPFLEYIVGQLLGSFHYIALAVIIDHCP